MTKFIGGVADGRDISVSDGANRMVIPSATYQPPAYVKESDPLEDPRIQTDSYRRMSVVGQSQQFDVFAEDSLDPDQVIQMLINGYTGSKAPPKRKQPSNAWMQPVQAWARPPDRMFPPQEFYKPLSLKPSRPEPAVSKQVTDALAAECLNDYKSRRVAGRISSSGDKPSE